MFRIVIRNIFWIKNMNKKCVKLPFVTFFYESKHDINYRSEHFLWIKKMFRIWIFGWEFWRWEWPPPPYKVGLGFTSKSALETMATKFSRPAKKNLGPKNFRRKFCTLTHWPMPPYHVPCDQGSIKKMNFLHW